MGRLITGNGDANARAVEHAEHGNPGHTRFLALILCASLSLANPPATGHGEPLRIGVQAGLDAVSVSYWLEGRLSDETIDDLWDEGFQVGATASYVFGNSGRYAVDWGLLYSSRGGKSRVPPFQEGLIWDLKYVAVPLLGKLYLNGGNHRAFIRGGIEFGLPIEGTLDRPGRPDESVARVKEEINGLRSVDVGLIFSVGLELKTNWRPVFFSVQYIHGLTDVINIEGTTYDAVLRSRVIGVIAGVYLW